MTRDPLAAMALQRGLTALRTMKDSASALVWLRFAVCADPGDGDLAAMVIAGPAADCLALARRARCLTPFAPGVLERAGEAAGSMGDHPAAELWFRKALIADPVGAVQAGVVVAGSLERAGRARAAYPLAWWTAETAGHNIGVLVRFAGLAMQVGRFAQAESAFAEANRQQPGNPAIAVSAAWAAWRNNNAATARRLARRAYLLSAADPDAMILLTRSEKDRSDALSLLVWSERIRIAAPLLESAWCHRSEAFQKAGHPRRALADAKRALVLDPADRLSARAFCHSAWALADLAALKRTARAGLLSHLRDPELSYHLGLAEKSIGDLGKGWDIAASRLSWFRFHAVRGLPPRRVAGPLPAEGLLVAAEQGIGDELLFLSCLPDLLADCPAPVVEADPRLHPLLARSFPGLQLIGRQLRQVDGRAVADYAEVTSRLGLTASLLAGDLPGRYRRRREAPAPAGGYLTVDPERRSAWAARIAQVSAGADLIVGLAWSSESQSKTRVLYNAPVEAMLEILKIPRIRFVSLQYTDPSAELSMLRQHHGIDVWDPEGLDQRNDLDGTAALMRALDVVISPEISVCILAAAVGCPTLRLGSSVYRVLDDRDLFFANMQPMIGQYEPINVPLAAARAAARLRERLSRLPSP